MFSLFAYTKDPAHRIVRFELDQEIQAGLTNYLQQQVQDFEMTIDEVPFDGKYKPEAGEKLVIGDFEDLDDLSHAVSAPIDIPVADPNTLNFETIRGLFFGGPAAEGEGQPTVYIQSFDRRRVISNAGFSIFHSAGTYRRMEGAGLTLDTKIAASLVGTKLSFCSFFAASRIFDMSSYFQEATDQDILDFSQLAKVSVSDQAALVEASDQWVRRKLWLVRNSGILERVQPNDMRAIAAEFDIAITYANEEGVEKLVIPVDRKQLKTLLRFLDEDYYKSPLSQTNFLSNSKRRV